MIVYLSIGQLIDRAIISLPSSSVSSPSKEHPIARHRELGPVAMEIGVDVIVEEYPAWNRLLNGPSQSTCVGVGERSYSYIHLTTGNMDSIIVQLLCCHHYDREELMGLLFLFSCS